MGENGVNDPIEFAQLSADTSEKPTEVESACIECGENVRQNNPGGLLEVDWGMHAV